MAEQVGAPEYDENGMIKKGVIIRHLILPGHTNESIKVLEFIKENYPGILVSLMCQYTPCGRAEEFPEINRKITKREYEKVSSAMFDLGFEDGFLQEIKSAGKKYIPDFDLTGIK